MGCCHTQKQIVKSKELPRQKIYQFQGLKKPASIDDETFQIMEQYLNSKHDAVNDLRQSDKVERNQLSIQFERRKPDENASEYTEIKQKYYQNKLFPLKCYCPQSCLCDRKEPHLWTHDVCKSTLYLDLDGEVVCLTCQYSEFLFQHCFMCPICSHASKFTTHDEFAQCSYSFIEDQQLKNNLAREQQEQQP